jgi:hypothetical protein
VTGAAIQVESNTGYLANSSARTVINLSAAPAAGEWVKVSGVGTARWTISQNAGQRISTLGLPGALDIRWTNRSTTRSWPGIAFSADGARLVAASASGELYTSTDQGLSWTLRLTGQVWSSMALSSDGLRLVGTTNGGSIFASKRAIAIDGFAAVKIADIMGQAGRSAAAFYIHFKSKEALLHELLKVFRIRLKDEVNRPSEAEDPLENLSDRLGALWTLYREDSLLMSKCRN